MSQGSEPGIDYLVQVRKGEPAAVGALVVTRSSQPIGFKDALSARVPGFEDITEQPDWGDNGFSGRKSDLRLIRFDREDAQE